MSKNKFSILLMALVAMSCFRPQESLAQRAFSPKIKTPNTSNELINESAPKPRQEADVEERDSSPLPVSSGRSSSPRQLQQHGLGIGLGETFLFGNYGKSGEDKITADILYSYAASYSFDLLVNAHWSEHKDEKERMEVKGINGSIKGRLVEYDNFSPFLLGGLGFYAPRAKRNIGNGVYRWTKEKVTFGLNFGGGLDLRLNDHVVVGVLAQLHWPFKVEQGSQSDLKGYYTKLMLTGMYLF